MKNRIVQNKVKPNFIYFNNYAELFFYLNQF